MKKCATQSSRDAKKTVKKQSITCTKAAIFCYIETNSPRPYVASFCHTDKVSGTSNGHTLDSGDCVRLERPNPDGPFLCELALSILIIIHVKRSSSLSPIALADMARGKAKTDPQNTPTQQCYSPRWRLRHTHRHTPTHSGTHTDTHRHMSSCQII